VPTLAPTAVPASATPTTVPTIASLQNLGDVAFDADGNLYISDCGQEGARILAIDSSGTLELYAGGDVGFDGDGGPANKARFWCLEDIAFDSAGNLYITDAFNGRIRKIEPNGIMSAVAGSGPSGDFLDINPAKGGFAGDDGPATEAMFSHPTDLALDLQGNLYILDRGNNRVRKVDPAGIITTFAGEGGYGFSGDGGPATAAKLSTTNGLAVDAAGNVYIADSDNARIRRVDLNGIITTIVGTGQAGFSGDGGPMAKAQLSSPKGMAFDAAGNLYFIDATTGSLETDRIRKIDAGGTITTVASAAHPGNPYEGDNYAGLNVDSQGNLYYRDAGNAFHKIDQDGNDTVLVEGCAGGCG
jgi:sugar lactone lactonase YvrE